MIENQEKRFCVKEDVGKEVFLVRKTQNPDVFRGYRKRIEKVTKKYATVDGLKFDVKGGLTINKDGSYTEPAIIWPGEAKELYGDRLSIFGEPETPEAKSEFVSACPDGRWKAEDALNCNFCLHGETCTKQQLMDFPNQLPETFVTGEKAADYKMITEGDYCWYKKFEKPLHEELSEQVATEDKEVAKARLRIERDASLKEKAYRNYKAQYDNLKKEEKRLKTKQEKLDEQLFLLREEIEAKAEDAEIEKNAYIAYCQLHGLTPDIGVAGEQITTDDFI